MCLGDAEVVGESDEELLGTVVEVALEATSLGVAGLDDACTRGAKVFELSSHFGLELLVLDCDARRGDDFLQ